MLLGISSNWVVDIQQKALVTLQGISRKERSVNAIFPTKLGNFSLI